MFLAKPKVYPVLYGCWMIATIIISYIVSVSLNHVYPVLPYISDTGTWAPESSIFGLMMTIGALLLLIILYIRYRQVEDLQEKKEFPHYLRRLNKWSLITGFVSFFSCLFIAQFQVGLVFKVHMSAAGFYMYFIIAYQVIQVVISFKVYPTIGKKKLNILRTFLSVLGALSVVISGLSGTAAFSKFKGKDITKWKPEDGGYVYHLIGAATEYAWMISSILYMVTFVDEFKVIDIQKPTIKNKI